MCYDGGKLVLCHRCQRAVCDQCILFPPGSLTKTAKFTCPDCWRKDSTTRDNPYKVATSHITSRFINYSASRGSLQRTNICLSEVTQLVGRSSQTSILGHSLSFLSAFLIFLRKATPHIWYSTRSSRIIATKQLSLLI
jgi:hypothetical protein